MAAETTPSDAAPDGLLPAPAGAVSGGSPVARLVGAVRAPWVRWAVGVCAVGLAVVTVASQWGDVVDAVRRMRPVWVAAAAVATLGNIVAAGEVWRCLLADSGPGLRWPVAAKVFFVGQLGKYVPGSVWPVVMQAELARDHGVGARRTASASMVTMVLGALTALVWFLLALPVVPTGLPTWTLWLTALVVPLLVVLHPRVLGWLLDLFARLTRGPVAETRPSARGVAGAVTWAMVSWAGSGLQVFCLTLALGGEPTWRALLLCTGGYCLAWVAGFVVILAPAGAGAREVVLAVVVAPLVGAGGVVVTVLVSRMLFSLGDLVMAAVGYSVGRGRAPARPGA